MQLFDSWLSCSLSLRSFNVLHFIIAVTLVLWCFVFSFIVKVLVFLHQVLRYYVHYRTPRKLILPDLLPLRLYLEYRITPLFTVVRSRLYLKVWCPLTLRFAAYVVVDGLVSHPDGVRHLRHSVIDSFAKGSL